MTPKHQRQWSPLLGPIVLPGLLDHFDQGCDLWFRPGMDKPVKLILRQVFFQISDDIEGLPPAINDLPAGLFAVTTFHAVFK